MVPVEQAAIGRQPAILAAPELRDAEIEAEHRQERAEDRGPGDRRAPQRPVAAQRGQVEPVRDGTHPIPQPLGRCRAQHDPAAGARNIDGRAFRVVEGEAVQGAVAAEAADGPLIFVDGLSGGEAGAADQPRGGVDGNRLGVGKSEIRDADTLGEIDHRIRPRRTAQPQYRDAEEGFDLDAIKLQVVGNEPILDPTAGLPPNGLQRAGPVALGKFGKLDIHHDDAGGEPDQHQDADRDPEIAVEYDQGAPQDVFHGRESNGIRRALHPGRCRAAADRPAPRAFGATMLSGVAGMAALQNCIPFRPAAREPVTLHPPPVPWYDYTIRSLRALH